MKLNNGCKEYTTVFLAIFFSVLLITVPDVCVSGAKRGLIICAGTLIPALFPFAVPVLFFLNTKVFKSINMKYFAVFVLSTVGGYPIGGKLIYQLYSNNEIDKSSAKKIIPFFINAGPSFIVLAVGKIMLNSIVLGYILLFSHIAGSIIASLVFIPHYIFKKTVNNTFDNCLSVTENFVSSIHNVAEACISISSFVIFFSVVNEYILYFSSRIGLLSFLTYITEVTSAVRRTENIYIISFLLGFAGISIWMQILSLSREIKPSLPWLIIVRIIHGFISAAITIVITKVTNINISALSNNIETLVKPMYTNLTLSLSLLFMAVVMLTSIVSKKHSGKILEDML